MQSDEDNYMGNQAYTKLLEAIVTEAKKTREDIKEEIKLENAKLFTKIEEQDTRIKDLESKYSKLEIKYKQLERQCRKNNIIIFGLEVQADVDIRQFVSNKFKDLLGIDIVESDINNVYQVMKNNNSQIKVEFINYFKKALVLENTKKLKGTQISIAQDLCYEDLQDQKILRKHLKLAKSKNHFAKIKGHKLIINNDVYTVEQLRQNEDNLDKHPCEEQQEEALHGLASTSSAGTKESPTKHLIKKKKNEKGTQGPSSELASTNLPPRITRQNQQK